MMYKLKVFLDPSNDSGAEKTENNLEGAEIKQETKELTEFKSYLEAQKGAGDSTASLLVSMLANNQENQHAMIKTYIDSQGDLNKDKRDLKKNRVLVAAWQCLLKQNNLYQDGDIDGKWGPKTDAAIAQFKSSNGITSENFQDFSTKLIEKSGEKTVNTNNPNENGNNSVEYSVNREERIKTAETKYNIVFDLFDWSKGEFKSGIIGDDGSLNLGGNIYKKIEQGNSTYNGLGYRVGTSERGNKFIEICTYKNGKADGTGAKIFSDGEKQFTDFKDGEKTGYWHIYFGKNNSRAEYIGSVKNNNLDGKGKLIMKDGKVYEGEFENDKFKGDKPTNITESTPGYDPSTGKSSGYEEKLGDKIVYKGDRISNQKIDATRLKNNLSALDSNNNYVKEGILSGTTYLSDGGYETISIGGQEELMNKALKGTEMNKNRRGTRAVTERLDKSGKNGTMRVHSRGREVGIKVENGTYRIQTQMGTKGGLLELGRGFTREGALLAADLINFGVRGTDDRIYEHSDESFDKFETDGSGVDLDLHGKSWSGDIHWIDSDAEKYFGGATNEQVARWMTDYYRYIKKINTK